MKSQAVRGALAGLVMFFAGASPVEAAQTRPVIEPGVYGDVSVSRKTGDMSGLEIEIHADGRTIDTTLCEGWCNLVIRTSYGRHGDAIEYEYRETEDYALRLRMTPEGRGLLVEQSLIPDNPEVGVRRYRLKRLKRPYGLAEARRIMREHRDQ